MTEIHDAAGAADVDLLRELLDAGADVNELDEYNFTPLGRAATAGEDADDVRQVVEAINLLVDRGANLEAGRPDDDRTPVYLAAEFSPSVEPVQALIDAGASLEFDGVLGEYMIENAHCEDTKELLMRLTGRPAPPEPLPDPPSVRLGKKAWAKAQDVLDRLFEQLNASNIVAEQDCGTTQEDAFSDCAEIFEERTEQGEKLTGICFYTRQDLNRAKRTSQLNIGIWGASEGGVKETAAIGHQLREAAEKLDIPVHWNGKSDIRPMLLLNQYKV